MEYHDFINGVNNGTIKKISFSVSDYSHYGNCIMESQYSNPNDENSSKIIWFYLTPDGYEKKGFLNKIKEDTKLFCFKGKGTFTLKQLWNKIKINSVEYYFFSNE